MTRPTVAAGHARAIIDSSDDAILSKDSRAIITSWNAGAARIYGYTSEEAIGNPVAMLVPPHLEGDEIRILNRILAGERIEHFETERLRKDGSTVIVSLTISPIYEGDEITGASVIARDITEQRRAQERAERLQRVTAALARETSLDRAANLALDESMPVLDAAAGLVALLEDDGLRIVPVAARGYSEEVLLAWRESEVAANAPMSVAIRTAEPVWCASDAELKDRFPGLPVTQDGLAARAVLPLSVDNRTFGVVAYGFAEDRSFTPQERAFLIAVSQQAANAIRRAQLRESERRAREQATFLAQASEILQRSLDLDTTLRHLAAVAVPGIADWCAVHLLEGERIRNVAIAHVDPAKVALAETYDRRYARDRNNDQGVAQVIRTGEPLLYPDLTDEILAAAARDEEHLELLRSLQIRSAMIVPLLSRAGQRGAITFISAESNQRFDRTSLALATDLARHASLAVDNAARYGQQRDTALSLQRALLPARMPQVPDVAYATRYLPAGPDVEAGGDWYDVIELGAGRLAVVIGDVSGRGIAAASVMGRLRTAIRAYALEGHGPAELAERVHLLMQDFEEREMATVFYLVLDTQSGAAEYVRAGHLPALLRDSSGAVREIGEVGSPPVGILPEPRFRSGTTSIERTCTVLLYTDGLVERRASGIDPGIKRLKRALAAAPADPEQCVEFILGELGQGDEEDDIALLALKLGT